MKRCLQEKSLIIFELGTEEEIEIIKQNYVTLIKSEQYEEWAGDTYLLKYNKENTINSENMRMCTLYKYEHTQIQTHTHTLSSTDSHGQNAKPRNQFDWFIDDEAKRD